MQFSHDCSIGLYEVMQDATVPDLCSFLQKMRTLFKIVFFSGTKWCQDRGSEPTAG